MATSPERRLTTHRSPCGSSPGGGWGWGGGGGAMGTGKRCTEGGKAGTLVKRVGGGGAAPAPPPASTPGDCAPASRRRPCARLWPRPSKKKRKGGGRGRKELVSCRWWRWESSPRGPAGSFSPPFPGTERDVAGGAERGGPKWESGCSTWLALPAAAARGKWRRRGPRRRRLAAEHSARGAGRRRPTSPLSSV